MTKEGNARFCVTRKETQDFASLRVKCGGHYNHRRGKAVIVYPYIWIHKMNCDFFIVFKKFFQNQPLGGTTLGSRYCKSTRECRFFFMADENC
jgi:hypothetical protein